MQAVFGSAFQVGVCTWCLQRTGPVFVAMFKPLGIVISALVGIIFLGDTIYLGRYIFSILGGVLTCMNFKNFCLIMLLVRSLIFCPDFLLFYYKKVIIPFLM